MKILITGSKGFLGRMISQELRIGNEIFDLSRNSEQYKFSLEKDLPVFNDNFEMVIHAAGKAHSIPKNESEIKEFYDINILGTLNLLKGLEKCTLPKEFVLISSVSVYGQETGQNINEEHSLSATDPYGFSKIKAEEIVKKWCNDNNIICTILRLPLLVGNNAPGNLGAMVKAIRKGYYFNIGGGIAKKSMILAKDVASFIEIVAPIGGIYNITDGIHPNFNELSLMISKNKKRQPNLPLTLAMFFGKIGDLFGNSFPINSLKIKKITSDLTFDDSKARELGWNPQSVLDYLKYNDL